MLLSSNYCQILGQIVTPGWYLALKTCLPVQAMKDLTYVTQLQSFFGLCNVYSRLVSIFSWKATPMTNKHHNYNFHTFIHMIEEEINLFRHLKEALVKPPALALPRSDLTYVYDNDACDKQLGAVLMQRCKYKSLRPAGYYSGNPTASKRNYDTNEREHLTICWIVLVISPYHYRTHLAHLDTRTEQDWL